MNSNVAFCQHSWLCQAVKTMLHTNLFLYEDVERRRGEVKHFSGSQLLE